MKDYQSALDMKETIIFCEKHKDKLLSKLPKSNKQFPYEIKNENHVQLDRNIINGILNLMPEKVRDKSIFNGIIGKSKHYFHKNSTSPSNMTDTPHIEDSISKTAIVPGKSSGENIYLYEMDLDPNLRNIVLAQAFAHEYLHSMNYNEDEILNFGELAEKYEPISTYSSFYREKSNEFYGCDLDTVKGSVEEELAESVAAYLLGFAFGNDDKKNLDPFKDRVEIKEYVKSLLEG